MRNPFKRQPRPADKPTLRERMAATREKFGRTLRVHRALNAPAPKPEPAPDRAALVNYATFLSWERRRICAELYPHLGDGARGFVLGMNAAEDFFYPDGVGNLLSRAWRDVPPASSRAVAVLDLVGVKWRDDPPGHGIERMVGGGRYADTGERPAVPYGWPAVDAGLVTAAGDLLRLDAAVAALIGDSGREPEGLPGYAALDEARTAALVTLSEERAESLHGLQAKARAILSPGLKGDPYTTEDLAHSLAHDLLRATNATIDPRPDPVFAVIEECRRLEAVSTAECSKPSGADGNCTPAQTATIKAVWSHIDGPLSETVPTTAAGCVALARFIPPLFERWGASLDGDQAGKLFRLIERSPAL